MDRSFARLAAVLLLGTSLLGCSTFSLGGSKPSATAAKDAAPAPGKTMAADLEGQIHRAQALRVAGDYKGATTMLSQLMMVAPDDPRVVGEYGKNLVEQGRSREALDFLKRAVELQPGDWTTYSAMGVAYDQNADYANARVAYEKALSMKPGNPGILNNYAVSRMQAGDLVTARQLMAQASAAGNADPKIGRNMQLIASLTPTQAAASAQARPAPMPAALVHPKPSAVVMQQIPNDPLAGRVKQASGAPKKLVSDDAKKNDDAKKAAAKNKTPSLRMTADAATP